MAANAEIYFEHDRWGRALAWSAGLHVGITVALLIYSAVVLPDEWRHVGRRWRRGGNRSDTGEHGSAPRESLADAERAGQ